jgi:hypothetical protein
MMQTSQQAVAVGSWELQIGVGTGFFIRLLVARL